MLRFVHRSDVHVWGHATRPHPSHVVKAVARPNQVEFPADRVVVTGDLVDYPADDLPPEDESTLRTAVRTPEGLSWPVRVGVGNHEDRGDAMLQVTADEAARDAWLSGVLGTDLDFAVVQNGVRVVMMNSMAGGQWSSSSGLVGSFTGPKPSWVRKQAADGTPTILLFHHPPVEDLATGGRDTLCQRHHQSPRGVPGGLRGPSPRLLERDLLRAALLPGAQRGSLGGVPRPGGVGRIGPSPVHRRRGGHPLPEPARIPVRPLRGDPGGSRDARGHGPRAAPGQPVHEPPGPDGIPRGRPRRPALRLPGGLLGCRDAEFPGPDAFARRQSGWYTYLDSVSCVDFPIQVDGPCGSGGPVRIDMDRAPCFGPSWTAPWTWPGPSAWKSRN